MTQIDAILVGLDPRKVTPLAGHTFKALVEITVTGFEVDVVDVTQLGGPTDALSGDVRQLSLLVRVKDVLT